tara:strand:- start:641 stop:1105 length:465 start_codon:yes stop_codon:yes gene_type:complete
MPGGYTNNSPYGALQPEDLHGNPALQEEAGNPVTEGNMYPASPVFDVPSQMGPEMGPYQQGMGQAPMGQMPMGQAPMAQAPMEQMGPGMGEMPMEQMPMEQMGPGMDEMAPEMGEGQMMPQDAGFILRERLKNRQRQMSDMSMQFAENAHELNK